MGRLNKKTYRSCQKAEKIKVSQRIVNAIRSQNPPGRFLELDSIKGAWHDIGDKRALEKTSQALRERRACNPEENPHPLLHKKSSPFRNQVQERKNMSSVDNLIRQ